MHKVLFRRNSFMTSLRALDSFSSRFFLHLRLLRKSPYTSSLSILRSALNVLPHPLTLMVLLSSRAFPVFHYQDLPHLLTLDLFRCIILTFSVSIITLSRVPLSVSEPLSTEEIIDLFSSKFSVSSLSLETNTGSNNDFFRVFS